MDHHDKMLAAARSMERLGGSFAAAIAQAYYCADSGNQARLLTAFGDLFERYAEYHRKHVDTIVALVRDRADETMWYSMGWDIVAEAWSSDDIAAYVHPTSTFDDVWQSIGAALGIPVSMTDYAVRVHDVDGLHVHQFETEAEAYSYAERMLGRPLQGTSDVSDYGTRITIVKP